MSIKRGTGKAKFTPDRVAFYASLIKANEKPLNYTGHSFVETNRYPSLGELCCFWAVPGAGESFNPDSLIQVPVPDEPYIDAYDVAPEPKLDTPLDKYVEMNKAIDKMTAPSEAARPGERWYASIDGSKEAYAVIIRHISDEVIQIDLTGSAQGSLTAYRRDAVELLENIDAGMTVGPGRADA